jgi:uncharacterized protein YeaO (DUF488 family)
MAGDHCAPVAEPAAPDDCCWARADSAPADYWVAPMAGDRCVPAVVRVAPHGCSADSAPADYWVAPMADDRCVPAVVRVAPHGCSADSAQADYWVVLLPADHSVRAAVLAAPHDCSVRVDSAADDCSAAPDSLQAYHSAVPLPADRCGPAVLQDSAVPADYSLPAGLPVRVEPQVAELRPDAGSLPVLPADCLGDSWQALPADFPAGSVPELELPLSPEALVSPEDSPAHSPDASSAILAAAKAGPDVVPSLAAWQQT